jgi:hypothetical protein
MIRYSVIISFFLAAASCGQHKQAVDKVNNYDSAIELKTKKQDTIANTEDTVKFKVKHEAYNKDIKDLPPTLTQFVPPGYTALDTTSGDLNLDDYRDMIMVLKKNGEDTSSDVSEHPEKRPLLILTGQADNTYKLAGRNDNTVYCIDCGGIMGDPFMDIVIKNGYFSVEHYGGSAWRWARTITYRYSPADNYWFLHKDGHESFHASIPDKVETKIRTTKDFGKVPFDEFDIYKD